MRVLVTRPQADAAELVAELRARGHGAMLQPLLTIEPTAPAPPIELDGVQALLFTSANGVRAFAPASPERGLPAFAVGDATAAAARQAGFGQVESAAGDVEDLVRLVADRVDPAGGRLLHVAGSRLAGDLKGSLEASGYTVRRVVLYDARPARAFSAEVSKALAEGLIDAVVFFSPRTAESFVRLIRDHRLAASCGRCQAVCLSPAVAAKLGSLRWAGIRVAVRPTREALLESLWQAADDAGAGASESSRDKDQP